MITIYEDIIQGTDEWKEIRYRKIGGSTAKKIMTNLNKSVKTCAVFCEILSEFMEEFDPFENELNVPAVIRGSEYEPLARKEYERVTGLTVKEIGWAELEDGFTGISPDGLIESFRKSIEIKCPSANTHAKYMIDFGEFLSDYCWQIVQNFMVLDIDSIDCISFRPENQIKPMIIFTATKDTFIQVSSTLTKPIGELIPMLKARTESLKQELESELVNQKESLTF